MYKKGHPPPKSAHPARTKSPTRRKTPHKNSRALSTARGKSNGARPPPPLSCCYYVRRNDAVTLPRIAYSGTKSHTKMTWPDQGTPEPVFRTP